MINGFRESMETPFPYDRYASGKNFIGRKSETVILESMLRSKQNVLLYDAPKTGKGSLIRHVLYNLKIGSYPFIACHVSLGNIRERAGFLASYASALVKAAASEAGGMKEIYDRFLAGTFLCLDLAEENGKGIFRPEKAPSREDEKAIFELGEKIAGYCGTAVIIVIEEFQNLLMFDDSNEILDTMESVLNGRENATYIFSGSRINAMKSIFEEERRFYRFAEHVPLQTIDEREITEYVIRGFSRGGKIIEHDLVLGAVRLFENNCWYINQFASICDSLSRGYINENTLMDALKMLIAVHSLRFRDMVDGMTGFQTDMFRAILDGVTRFSATETIEKYGLNSSANVRRLKDALKKKEIITFDEKDIPHVIDPLFKYWMKKYYFKQET